MTKLEQSFDKVCAAKGLHNLSISYNPIQRGFTTAWFTVYAHRDDFCVSGTGDTIAEALTEALVKLTAHTNSVLADEALPVLA